LWEKAKAGEITIGGAYDEIKKQVKIQKRADEIESIKKGIETGVGIVEGLFEVVVIDPPWQYNNNNVYDPEAFRGTTTYPEMSMESIKAISLPLAEDAVVFLWTTHAFLKDAFDVLDAWNLQYKATFVWDKEKMGIGRNIRLQCEFCLLATKGHPIINGQSTRDIIREPRREHSRKPEKFYRLVEEMTIGRKLDYFSRENKEGWISYGAETEKF
jgi:N6-adenosine-specific RNA methylase IME4